MVKHIVMWNLTDKDKVAENGARIPIRLIPYYAWGNRGESEMTVWMLLER